MVTWCNDLQSKENKIPVLQKLHHTGLRKGIITWHKQSGSRHCHCIASFLDVAFLVDNEENPEAVLDDVEMAEDAEGKLGGPSKTFEVAPSKSLIGRVFST